MPLLRCAPTHRTIRRTASRTIDPATRVSAVVRLGPRRSTRSLLTRDRHCPTSQRHPPSASAWPPPSGPWLWLVPSWSCCHCPRWPTTRQAPPRRPRRSSSRRPRPRRRPRRRRRRRHRDPTPIPTPTDPPGAGSESDPTPAPTAGPTPTPTPTATPGPTPTPTPPPPATVDKSVVLYRAGSLAAVRQYRRTTGASRPRPRR